MCLNHSKRPRPLPPIMSLAAPPALPAGPIASNSGSNQQDSKDDKPTVLAGSKQNTPPYKANHKKARTGPPRAGHITLTKELLFFLHKAPDKGVHVIAKIAHRQIIRAAACAARMRTLLYDIFMEAMGDNYISSQLEKGKLHIAGTRQHKHSTGVPPKYAFATLLLNAASQSEQEPLPTYGRMSNHSKHIHKRLLHITEDYEITTRSAALIFNFGQCYRHITPTIVEELKRVRSIPWPIKLEAQD